MRAGFGLMELGFGWQQVKDKFLAKHGAKTWAETWYRVFGQICFGLK